jgi:hypothetical protein
MGEPDSVSYGVWLYGGSEITFGYGVVLDYSDAGNVLRLCPDEVEPSTEGATDDSIRG